jgi:hypothetical protein
MKARVITALVITLVAVAASLTIATGNARAAQIQRATTFECGAGSATVYFPLVYTLSGYETVYYSPDLWKYTDGAGWAPYDTSKPWYGASVGPGGVIGSWYIHPSRYDVNRIPFWNLPAGWYAVKGYFFQGSSHWGTVWGTNSTMCYVS